MFLKNTVKYRDTDLFKKKYRDMKSFLYCPALTALQEYKPQTKCSFWHDKGLNFIETIK